MLPALLMLMLLLLMGDVGVNGAPYDKGSRQEEAVTRCIVEVLSNALAKPNAPPIDPECKEILRKSSRHNQEEEGGDRKQFEIRTIKDHEAPDKHQHNSKEAKQSEDLPKEEYEEKRHHAETENRGEKEEERVKETEQFDEKEESTGHSKERAFAEGEDEDDDDEERGDHKGHYEKEDEEKRNKHHDDSEESERDILDKRAHHTSKHPEEFPGEDHEDDAKNLEEMIKRHSVSKIWKEQPVKFHSIHSSETPEENDGWEEEEEKEKRSFTPNHQELRPRLYGYEEKQSHHEEPRNPLTEEKTSYSRGQKPHFGEDSLENSLIKNYFDKRFHHDKESSEQVRDKKHHHQDSEEETEQQASSEENNEKELTGHHYEDKRRHDERKRWPSQQNSRINYEESNEDSEESEEAFDKRHEHEQDKDNFYSKLKHHLQESDEDEPFRQEKKQDEKRYYIGEEMVDGMKRYFPKLSQEKDFRQYGENKNHHYREDSHESNFPNKQMYKQEERRSFNKHGLSNDPLRWQSRYFDNADNSEEDRKRSLQVKNVFPDYGDYDLWGKRQFLEDVNHQYGEHRSPSKTHKSEDKREYDRMDELAQLLNYKKKSVEFPDFYDSEEIKKRHYDERGRFRERPLTEEEEKELENLAIMDLELQKIAETLGNNRQG